MCLAISNFKWNLNGYIVKLNCTHIQAVFCLLEINSVLTNVLIMKETSKIPFPTYREQDCTREHYNGIKGKLQINDKFAF